MKNSIIFLFLVSCAGTFKKQIEEQQAQILQLQTIRERQEEKLIYLKKTVKRMTVRVNEKPIEPVPGKPREVCVGIEDTGEEVCITFLPTE